MANITYAGTNLNNGQPDNSSACVTGFDQAGFMMGSSASLFNVSALRYAVDPSLTALLANSGLCAKYDCWLHR